ncbi:hypothetical protein DICPUDRAFT_82561 [Dictyostelium purpureum]|uniref:Uncharacterized protein n=1 Tax=Dictyostelium purpureum TaxID=5786 RepID=F0ZWW4_DICPU|nr:uncharacterized protein DICPUDRAFT_82561 [Dictyostelium purpureum]EGC31568.1 hypothetical protein DICPUDRAFT_82561 [Dictyostelium purpureum]|eukprot:XP_003291910.1 hypothetical protein DICPUDRAFT_82561 [Dictyostelium purpureum]
MCCLIDINSNIQYNNTLCGLLDNDKKQIYPPCKSFSDAGKVSSDLEIVYDKIGDFISFLIVHSEGENEIIVENDSLGQLNYFCNINFVIVDNNLKPIKTSVPIVTINGKNATQDFLTTNEEIIYYKCSNITFSMNYFNFINWNRHSILKVNLQENSIGFNRTFEFTNCIFNNSNSIVKTIRFSNSLIELVHKKLYFISCIFDEINSKFSMNKYYPNNDKLSIIETSWTDIYFINSIIKNSRFGRKPFLLIQNRALIKFSNTSIYNNIIKNQFINIINDVDVSIDKLDVFNNTVNQFFYISNDIKLNTKIHYRMKYLNFKNNIFKSNSLGDNNDVFILNINATKKGQDVDYSMDNNYISIGYSVFTDNSYFESNHTQNFKLLYANSNCRIRFYQTLVGKEFSDAISAPFPYSVIISNSEIQSHHPVIAFNTTLYLFNSSIPNKFILEQGSIVYSNTSYDGSNDDDFYTSNDHSGNNKYNSNETHIDIGKLTRDNNKLVLVIVLSIGIPLAIFSSSIIIYFIIKKSDRCKHKKKEEETKENTIHTDLDMNEFEANVDNVDASTSTEDLKKKINLDDGEPESD